MAEANLDAAASAIGAEAGQILDADHQKMLDELAALSGPEFDRAYAKNRLATHQEPSEMLADYIAGGDDPILRRYAIEMLPVVTMHLRRIEAIAAM